MKIRNMKSLATRFKLIARLHMAIDKLMGNQALSRVVIPGMATGGTG
jgi:hypothetical protein